MLPKKTVAEGGKMWSGDMRVEMVNQWFGGLSTALVTLGHRLIVTAIRLSRVEETYMRIPPWFMAMVACVVPFSVAGQGKSDNPLRNARVGDFAVYKVTLHADERIIEVIIKKQVVAKSGSEATLKLTSTEMGESRAPELQKIDLAKPYDPLTVMGRAHKFEKTGDGKEKLKLGDKAYDCNWVSGKQTNDTEVKVSAVEDFFFFTQVVDMMRGATISVETVPVQQGLAHTSDTSPLYTAAADGSVLVTLEGARGGNLPKNIVVEVQLNPGTGRAYTFRQQTVEGEGRISLPVRAGETYQVTVNGAGAAFDATLGIRRFSSMPFQTLPDSEIPYVGLRQVKASDLSVNSKTPAGGGHFKHTITATAYGLMAVRASAPDVGNGIDDNGDGTTDEPGEDRNLDMSVLITPSIGPSFTRSDKSTNNVPDVFFYVSPGDRIDVTLSDSSFLQHEVPFLLTAAVEQDIDEGSGSPFSQDMTIPVGRNSETLQSRALEFGRFTYSALSADLPGISGPVPSEINMSVSVFDVSGKRKQKIDDLSPGNLARVVVDVQPNDLVEITLIKGADLTGIELPYTLTTEIKEPGDYHAVRTYDGPLSSQGVSTGNQYQAWKDFERVMSREGYFGLGLFGPRASSGFSLTGGGTPFGFGVQAFDGANGLVTFAGDQGGEFDNALMLWEEGGYLAHNASAGDFADSTDIDPGPGIDRLLIATAFRIQVDAGQGNDVVDASRLALAGVRLMGGLGNDHLTGSNSFCGDVIDGGEGEDTIFGLGGNDLIRGGTGSDPILDGGAGNDFILGGGGADHIIMGGGFDEVDGGSDVDSLVFQGAAGDFLVSSFILNTVLLAAADLSSTGLFGAQNVEQVKVNASTSADTVFIRSTSETTQVNVATFAGSDTFLVSSFASRNSARNAVASGNLDDIRGVLYLDAGGDSGNRLIVNDFDGGPNLNVTVTQDKISGLAGPSNSVNIFYTASGNFSNGASNDGVLIRGSGTHTDVFHVLSTRAGNTIKITTEGGKDTIYVGSTAPLNSTNLDDIQGLLTLVGGGDADNIFVDDRGKVGRANYTLNPTQLVNLGVLDGFVADCLPESVYNPPRPLFAGIHYDGTTEFLRLDGTDDVNIFDVTPSLYTEHYVDGNLPPPHSCIEGGGDYLMLNTDNTSGRKIKIVAPGEGTWSFSSPHKAVGFESIERFNHLDIRATASNPGAPPRVEVRDAETGELRFTVFPFETSFLGGLSIATGDVNCDGFPDLIVAPASGRVSTVQIFDGSPDANGNYPARRIASFDVFPATFKGGADIAIADVNCDGDNDLVVGAGAGWLPIVQIFDGKTLTSGNPTTLSSPLHVFESTYRGGVTLTSANVVGDGDAEIIVARGPGTSSEVRIYDWESRSLVKQFEPLPSTVKTGVSLAVGDFDGDTKRDLIVGALTGWMPDVFLFDGNSLRAPGTPVPTSFHAYDSAYRGGVSVSTTPVDGGNPGFVEKVHLWTNPANGRLDQPEQKFEGNGLNPVLVSSFTNIGVPPLIVVGGATNGHVQAFDGITGNLKFNIIAFPGILAPVSVAVGDINADGHQDIIVGAPYNAHVKVFDGQSGALIRNFLAFPGFPGAVTVAAGDINGDGHADIVVGAAANGHVQVFDGQTGASIRSFLAFGGYTGGVNVAAGDINGDKRADLIVAAHVNSHVQVFDGVTGASIRSFLAFSGFGGPVSVAAGDINGDDLADLIIGAAGPGAPPHVKVFDGQDLRLIHSFLAYDSNVLDHGVSVGVVDFGGDGAIDLVVAPGPRRIAPVRVLGGLSLQELDAFFAIDERYGAGLSIGG